MDAVGIEVASGGIRVDAEVIAEGLGIAASEVLEALRTGRVTSKLEKGSEEDEGRYRLTFFGESGRFQVVVDARGRVLRRFKVSGRARARARAGQGTS
ncbi:MAG: DUF6522 family protein [Steroidobacteraceae bacterium]